MKIKLFVTCEIQYFELGIFFFNSYVYHLSRGFIASARAFNLLTRAFYPQTRAFNHATRAFSLLTRGLEPVTCQFELVTRGFELVIRGCELVTRGFELVLFHVNTRIININSNLSLSHASKIEALIPSAWACLTFSTLRNFTELMVFLYYLKTKHKWSLVL